MPSGLLVLQLLLCSFNTFSTSISNLQTLPANFPSNIVVQRELRATVARLWEGSPTFRAQCLKIGEHRLYRVAVVKDPALAVDRTCRAQCVLRVYSTGFVTARVTVPGGPHLAELIPHELEHVVEHIEGINVTREVGRHGRGTYDAGYGRIETVRAVEAGRRARQEVDAADSAVTILTRR